MSQVKKIAIDTLPLVSGHAARGTGVYTRNLISAVEKQLLDNNDIELIKFNSLENSQRIAEYDLVHYPYFDLFYHSLPIRKQTKTIVVVHDVTPLLYPEHYPPGVRGKINFMLQKLSLRNVDGIITVSETSKKDIVRYLNVNPDQVHVVYLAPNFKVVKLPQDKLLKIKAKLALPDEFILYIGDVNWNKNLINLVEAVKSLNKKLVIVGKAAVNTEYDKSHIENKPLHTLQTKYGKDENIIRLGYVEDDDLNGIWQLATLYCMPSLYEGFGLSVVEAMQARVPLVCAKTQALKEVAQDASVYFDPKNVVDMAEKIYMVLKSKKLQKQLVQNGNIRSEFFSWERTALHTIDVYKKVLFK